jgi:uncharacterized membrane protein
MDFGVVLAIFALVCTWVVYGHVANLRSQVEQLREQLKRLQDQASQPERAPGSPPATASQAAAAQPVPSRTAPLPSEPPRPTPVAQPPKPKPIEPPKPIEQPRPQPVAPKVEPVAAGAPPPPPPSPKPPAPPKPKIAWEQQIGARLPVWIGGIALALSGVFLVKYSIDTGLLNPLVRCILAGLLGAAMIVVAQILLAYRVANAERIAQALSGAGISVLYGTLFAASTVYGFISPVIAFAGMAANTALAVVLSLRQGPPIAVLGMVGGFLTPVLVGSGEPNAGVLFSYLIALTIGLFTVVRRQKWWWLAWPTLGAAFLWVFIWLGGPKIAGEGLWIGLFLILLCGAAFSFVNPAAKQGESPPNAWMGLTATSALATILMGVVVERSGFGFVEWGLYYALTVGTIVLPARDQSLYRYIPWLSLGVSVVLLGVWSPQATEYLAGLIFLFALTFAGAGVTLMWRAADKIEWSRLACVSAFAFFFLAIYRLQSSLIQIKATAPDALLAQLPVWGIVATLAAAAFTLVAGRAVERFKTETKEAQTLLAHLALTPIAFMGLGLVLELHPNYLPVAVAGLLFAVSFVAVRVDIAVLRPAAAVVAALFVVALLPQLAALLQYAMSASLGQARAIATPLMAQNPIFHLGIPAAFFLGAAWQLRRDIDDTVGQAFDVMTAILTGLMGYFLIRQAQTPVAEMFATQGTPFDGGVISNLLIAYGIALTALGDRLKRRALAISGVAAAGLGLVRVIHFDIQPLQLAEVWLPMAFGDVSRQIVTLPIATSPLFYLGLPAALLLGLRLLFGRADNWLVRTLEYMPVALVGLMGYFLIRHAFNPLEEVLSGTGSRFEGGIISMAQLVYAILLVFAAQYFNRTTLITAAVVAGAIAVLRIIGFDIQLATFLANAANLAGSGSALGLTPIPISIAPIFHLALPAGLIAVLSYTLRGKRERVAELLEYAAIVFVGLMGYYLVRQAFNGVENAFAAPGTYLERGVITNALLIFGVALFLAGRRINRRTLFICGSAAALFAVFRVFVFDYLMSSPLSAAHDVGTFPIVNALLLPYGLPVVWLALLAQALQSRGRTELVPAVKGAALISLFAWVSLNVRQIFQGPFLEASRGIDGNEVYAYSVAWLAIGVGLLVVGTAWKDRAIRIASAVVMTLVVGKVFLYDVSELGDLLRIASFGGLGISLVGLDWFYARYVFASDEPKPEG